MSWEDEFRRKRLVSATDIPPDEPPEMPWRSRARASLDGRNWREAIKRFFGDPKRAAQYIPVAQTILGGLVHQLRLGGIEYGHRIVNLPDGARIRAIHNSGINVIEIFAPLVGQLEELVKQVLLHGFIVYPRSKAASKGWALDTKLNRILRVGDSLILYPSCRNDGLVRYYMALGYDNNGYNGYYFPNMYYDLFYRGAVTYDVEADVTNTILINQQLYHGNQYQFSGDTVYSWWHSSFGDLPVDSHAATAWNPGYFYGVNAKLNSSYQFKQLVGHLYYTDTSNKAFYLLPGIMKNGVPFVDFSLRLTSLDGFDNILNAARHCVAGFFAINETQFLVSLVRDWTSFIIYQCKVTDKFFVPKMEVLYSSEELSIAASGLTAPFRFNSTGTECATVFARPHKVEGSNVVYPQPTLLVIKLLREEDEELGVVYTYHSHKITEYTVFEETQDSGYSRTSSAEDAGWKSASYWVPYSPGYDYTITTDYHVYSERKEVGASSSFRESSRRYLGDTRFPVAVNYRGDELLKIELDVSGTKDYVVSNENGNYEKLKVKFDVFRQSNGTTGVVLGGASDRIVYHTQGENTLRYSRSDEIAMQLLVDGASYTLGGDTLLSVREVDHTEDLTGYAYYDGNVTDKSYQALESGGQKKTVIYVDLLSGIVITSHVGAGVLREVRFREYVSLFDGTVTPGHTDTKWWTLNLNVYRNFEFHNIDKTVRAYGGDPIAYNHSATGLPTGVELFFHAGTNPTPYKSLVPVWPRVPRSEVWAVHSIAVDQRKTVREAIKNRALGLFAFQVFNFSVKFNGNVVAVPGFAGYFTTLNGVEAKLSEQPVEIEYLNPFGLF